jgi:serine/threonine protein kinase
MSYLRSLRNNRESIIHIGADTDYPYIRMTLREKYNRFISTLISQIIKDLLELVYFNESYGPDLPSLSKVKFQCDCEAEFMTPAKKQHKRNRLREHSSSGHVCMKKPVSILKDIAIKLIVHNSESVRDILPSGEEENSNISDNHPDTNTAGSWYDSLHNGDFDEWETEGWETEGRINEYDLIRSKIDLLTRRFMRDLIVGKKPKNPILLKFEEIGGYYPISIICESSHSVVIRAKTVTNDEIYALKIGSASVDGDVLLRKELEILDSFESRPSCFPNIVDSFVIKSMIDEFDHRCLAFDLYGLDLFEKILNDPSYYKIGLSIDSVRHIAFQLVIGIDYLHKRQIIHNDIKMENILFKNPIIDANHIINQDGASNTDLDIMLIDYGLSIEVNRSKNRIQGTIPYLSPEEIEGKIGSFETDIWSLGVVLLELATGISMFGTHVYENMSIVEAITDYQFNTLNQDIGHFENFELARAEFNSEDRFDMRGVKYDMHYIPYSANDEHLADFLSGCLNPNKDERYNIEQLYYHPFLSRYSQDIKNRRISLD